MWDRVFLDCDLATMTQGPRAYGLIVAGALGIADGRIAWVGRRDALPDAPQRLAHEVVSLDGALVTPGLIDCHTHLVFEGDRSDEFERRLSGATYEAIAAAGGGILSTVARTRAATEDDLVRSALPRLDALVRDGVTTVEIKSGYGLDTETELKMLRAAGRLAGERAIRVRRTFLGAHMVPPEYRDRRDIYVDLVCNEMIPTVAAERAADAVDAFCETIAFTANEVDRILSAAHAHGLAVKLHAEQLADSGGAALAARHGALSADHLEHLGTDGIEAMREAETVAVLLPGAFYTLQANSKPPVGALREAGVPIALATDCNPGTSPLLSPRLAMNMGCLLFGLTPEEALAGMTRCAARALALEDEIGTLEVGKAADLAVWRTRTPAELIYWMGGSPLLSAYLGGVERIDRREVITP